RLRTAVRRELRQAPAGAEAEEAARGGRRALPRDGRGPGGRGDRLAPPGGPEAEGPGPPDGVQRDHQGRDPAGGREPPFAEPAAGGRAGDAPHPGPPRSEEHTSELQSRETIVCRLLLEKK